MDAEGRRPLRFWTITCISLVAVIGIYRLVVGWPTTPMTVDKANSLYGSELKSGMSQSEVETWLISKGIHNEQTGQFDLSPTHYSIRAGRSGITVGHDTIEKMADVDSNQIKTTILVEYPDADHDFISRDILTVYLFFDKENRFIKHWVNVFNLAP